MFLWKWKAAHNLRSVEWKLNLRERLISKGRTLSPTFCPASECLPPANASAPPRLKMLPESSSQSVHANRIYAAHKGSLLLVSLAAPQFILPWNPCLLEPQPVSLGTLSVPFPGMALEKLGRRPEPPWGASQQGPRIK